MPALLLPNEILSMSAQAARRLIEAGEGDCALLYLALLDGDDANKAQRALHWGDARLSAAWHRLVELGLAAEESAPATAKKQELEELPQYSRQDIVDALTNEPDFCALYQEVERLFGRHIGDMDLQTLYTIYDGLALPAEVILLLVNHKIHMMRRQEQKEGTVPRMTQIRSEAAYWKRLGLDTVETAEEYLRKQQQVDHREWAILSAVGVTKQRAAVERERNYIRSWVELGISDELIAMAYERTVYKKGEMNWPYMHKILLAWHQAGFRTPEQVKAGDKPANKRPAPKGGKQNENYQPSLERIRKNDEWLDEFLRQQGKEV